MEYEAKLPPQYMEANRLWDVEQGQRAASPIATGWWPPTSARSPTGCRSTRSWPRSPARSTGSASRSTARTCPRAITAMMNYYERYQPDVVLAYNDLAKEAEAFGCRVKYSDYVVPSIDAARAARGQGGAGPARHARSVQDRAAARLPRAVRGPGQGQAARPRSARWRSGRGRSPCCCATPRRCCSTPSRTRSSSTTSCGSPPTSARSGATPSSRPGSGSPSPSRPPRSA